MNKIMKAHKSQMDIINNGFDRADFERKAEREDPQDKATELEVEEILEARHEKLASKAWEDTENNEERATRENMESVLDQEQMWGEKI
uniref:Uncharacterized protein n=1 Tax=viral metagenome TaxID=1070528 RepID=A0A6H1ZF30_9ZZZZ